MGADYPYGGFPSPPARLSPGQPGELLFEFVRASDGAPIRCELRFHGESYGWEAQFLDRGELWYAHGSDAGLNSCATFYSVLLRFTGIDRRDGTEVQVVGPGWRR
jgi:hypothetical protein